MRHARPLLVSSYLIAVVACGQDTSGSEIFRPSGQDEALSVAAVPASMTSNDGLLTLTVSATEPSNTAGVSNMYTWTATNNSATTSLTGVTLGSHWGDYCGSASCTPSGPTLTGAGPGCGSQSPDEFPTSAHLGEWCTPTTGVTLAPHTAISGSVSIRPEVGGPANYTVYSLYNDPVTGRQHVIDAPVLSDERVVATRAIDEQISGSASTGSPAVGASYVYTYNVRNAGQGGTFGGVTFTDTLPAGVAFMSFAMNPFVGNACSVVGQTVTCSIPDVLNQKGETTTIALTVQAPSSGPQEIVNTATIAFGAPQTDANTANNAVTITVTSR